MYRKIMKSTTLPFIIPEIGIINSTLLHDTATPHTARNTEKL